MRLLKGELGLLIILAALCIVFGIISRISGWSATCST